MNIRLSLGLMLVAALLIMSCGRTEHEIDAPKAMPGPPVPVATPSVTVFYQTTIPDAPTPTATPTPPKMSAPVTVSAPPLPLIPQSPVASDRNLFVVISGNGTCNPKLNSPAVPGLWRTDLFDSFIGSILNGGLVRAQDNVLFLCYERLSPQMNVFDLRSSRQMEPIHEAQVDDLVLSRLGGVRRVFMIGYSYGGWRAMKLASSPRLIAASPLPLTLVTIDPISKVTCTRAFDAGCHESPQDFRLAELKQLNTHTRWINLFETQGLLVSSGFIAAAHQNIEINANHLTVATHGDVWNTVVPFFSTQLNSMGELARAQ